MTLLRPLLTAFALASGLGCLARPAFTCQSSEQCDLMPGGQCQADGTCRYPEGGRSSTSSASSSSGAVTTSGAAGMSSTGGSGDSAGMSSSGGPTDASSTSSTGDASSTSGTGDASSTSSTGDASSTGEVGTGSSSTGGGNCVVNAVLDEGEECDDGDDDDANQCSNSCIKRWQWIFVSPEAKTPAGFGGIQAADAYCTKAAENALLPGTHKYRVWLSNDTYAPGIIDGGFQHYDRPYVMPVLGSKGGIKIAESWDTLASANHLHAIDSDAKGIHINSTSEDCHPSRLVWSNTDIMGLSIGGQHCGSFNSGSSNSVGRVGRLDRVDAQWTNATCPTKPCNVALRIYCVEQ